MSRTYRCKNHVPPKSYYYSKEEFEDLGRTGSKQYRWANRTFLDYEHYLKVERALWHSERASKCYFGYGSRVPRAINNSYYERPLRREVSQELHHAIRKGEEDCVVFKTPKHMKCTGYWYW